MMHKTISRKQCFLGRKGRKNFYRPFRWVTLDKHLILADVRLRLRYLVPFLHGPFQSENGPFVRGRMRVELISAKELYPPTYKRSGGEAGDV